MGLPARPTRGVPASRTIAQQQRGAVPRRARIKGSWIVVSQNSRLESNKEERTRPDAAANLTLQRVWGLGFGV